MAINLFKFYNIGEKFGKPAQYVFRNVGGNSTANKENVYLSLVKQLLKSNYTVVIRPFKYINYFSKQK